MSAVHSGGTSQGSPTAVDALTTCSVFVLRQFWARKDKMVVQFVTTPTAPRNTFGSDHDKEGYPTKAFRIKYSAETDTSDSRYTVDANSLDIPSLCLIVCT